MLKSCITKECELSVTKGQLNYTDSGYIQKTKDVWRTMIHLFGDHTGAATDRQVSKQNGISHYMFFYCDYDENLIPRVEETFRMMKPNPQSGGDFQDAEWHLQ